MITDLLDRMTRRQLEVEAKEIKVQSWRYPTKALLVAAIRKKRTSK